MQNDATLWNMHEYQLEIAAVYHNKFPNKFILILHIYIYPLVSTRFVYSIIEIA